MSATLMPADPSLSMTSSGTLAIDGCDVTEIVAHHGAPVWIVSDSAIRANLADIRTAFAHHYPDVRVLYASKANPEPAILQIVREEGAGIDVVTAGHVRLALMAG